MSRVMILGAGWLGLALAKVLRDSGYDVTGTYRSEHTRHNLETAGIESLHVDLCAPHLPQKLYDTDVLCIFIPPSNNLEYVKILTKITQNAKFKDLKQVIFTSSTSVYIENNEPKDENAPINPQSIIAQAEQVFAPYPQCTILRMSGLMGGSRYLLKYFKDVVPLSETRANHIHQDDAIALIKRAIADKLQGTYNVCAPEHPTRAQIIQKQCEKLQQKLPLMKQGASPKGIILADKIQTALAYHFVRPDPTNFI